MGPEKFSAASTTSDAIIPRVIRRASLSSASVLLLLLSASRAAPDPSDVSRLNWIFDGAVQAAARVGDVLYVGGTFRGVAPSANVVPPVYALAPGSGALVTPALPVASGQVSAVLPDGSGGHFLAGAFTLTGASTPTAVAHVLADGSVDPGFNAAVTGAPAGIARVGATLYLIGTFTVPAPQFSASAIAISATNGSPVPWAPVLAPLVPAAIVAGDDRLVIIGSESVPMVTSGVAAAFDAASGAELWRTAVAPGGVGAASARRAWTGVRDGARVIVAHSPTNSNGGLSSVSLATGAIDPGWNPQVSPQTLALSGGVLYVGGFFTSVAGQARSSLAAIDRATAALLPWNPGLAPPILRMAPSATGGVFVTGLFETIGTGGAARWRLAEIDAAGVVTPWVAATRPESVTLLAAGAGGSLIVASSLTATGYVPRSRLAAFDLATGALLPWAPAANGAVAVMGASGGRVTVGGAFTTMDGQPAARGAALDATTGTLLPWTPTAPGTASFTDGEWFYWAVGPQPSGPFVTERYALSTGALDPAWRLAFGAGGSWAVDGQVLYSGSSLGLAAIDRRTARLRWFARGRVVTGLAVSGDTLFTYGVVEGLATHDARSGALLATYATPTARAVSVADGRVLAIEALPPVGFTPQAGLMARRFDGTGSAWNPAGARELIGGPAEMIAPLGNVVVAGGLFGARAPQARLGLAAFDRQGAPAPSALRARPSGPATEFTWDPPAGAPSGGYVLEAGVSPGQTIAALPLGNVTRFSTIVPPGRFFVRVRTSGAVGGNEEVSNEILVSGGCTAAPPPPVNFGVVLFGAGLDRATFSWSAPEAVVSSYTLVAGSAPGLADIASIPLSATSTGLTYASAIPPGTYYVRVRAANACGQSAFTPNLRMTIGAGVDVPLAPLNLTATGGAATQLTWTPPAGAVTGYVLEAGSDVGLADLATVALGPTPSFTVPPIPSGVYVLRVRAVNAAGTGPPSADLVLRVP